MTRKQIPLIVVALLVLSFAIALKAQSPQNDHEAKSQHETAIIAALHKPDGLHEAAKLNGGTYYLGKSWYGFSRLSTLESLAKYCGMAVIGTPVSSEVKLINDGRSITTRYKLKVLEAIQGKVQWDDVVTVDLLGGKIAFDDGTTAEIDVGDLPRLQIGRRYVIYLEFDPQDNTFLPLGGPAGIFELGANGKVAPFATPEHTQAAAKGDDVLEFLEKVRDLSRLQKKQ